ncbi:MAG: TonB-dependent receptor [Bacteroidales bacterium]|nr:TonB-dependent receptor [Bacteroidales bacterium]
MKTTILFILFLIFLGNVKVFSQKQEITNFEAKISGYVLEEKTKTPLNYANIVLIRSRDSMIVNGAISDEKGYFLIDKVHIGKYILKVHYIGFNTYKTEILVTPKNSYIELGNIYLKPYSHQLAEIEIVEEKPQIEFKLDKKVINVDKNITTIGGSVIDVLRNTPMVDVDMDGNISLRGNTNVTILIDGRPSVLLSGSDRSNALEQIPANSVDRIEIITNPSAKYDPEGTAGIINIITKKSIKQSLNGQISVSYGTLRKFGGGITLNKSFNKLATFVSYDYRIEDRIGYRNIDRYFIKSDTVTSRSVVNANNLGYHFSHSFKVGADYSLDKNTTLNINFSGRVGSRKGVDSTIYKNYDYKGIPTSYYRRDEDNNNPMNNIDVNIGGRRKFNKQGHELTSDFLLSFSDRAKNEKFTQINYFPILTIPPEKLEDKDKDRNITWQLDYVNPINGKAKIEAGIKLMNRNNNNDYIYYIYSDAFYSYLIDTTRTNNFEFSDYVYAGYLTFGKELKKFSFQTGIRAEYTQIEGNQKTTNYKFNRDYFDIFPTVHLNYELPGKNKLQISYSKRINRSWAREYNPFVNKSDPMTWHTGNPDLKPEYAGSYELSYLKDWNTLSITASIFYKFTNNVINRYRKIDTVTNIVTVYPFNMDKQEDIGFEIVFNKTFFRIIRSTGTFAYYKQNIYGSANNYDLSNSTYTYNFRINNFITLPKSFVVQINGMFNGPSIMARARREAFYTIDIGLRKDILNKRANISVRASDIFNTMKFRVKTNDINMKATMEFKRETRVIYISFTYKINEGIKQKERKRQSEQEMYNEMIDF